MTALEVLVHVLAVHRLVRFVSADSLGGAAFRWRLIRWAYLRAGHDADLVDCLGPQLDEMVKADLHDRRCWDEAPPKLAELISCRWCASVWVSAAWVPLAVHVPWLWWVALVLALSSASTLLAGFED